MKRTALGYFRKARPPTMCASTSRHAARRLGACDQDERDTLARRGAH